LTPPQTGIWAHAWHASPVPTPSLLCDQHRYTCGDRGAPALLASRDGRETSLRQEEGRGLRPPASAQEVDWRTARTVPLSVALGEERTLLLRATGEGTPSPHPQAQLQSRPQASVALGEERTLLLRATGEGTPSPHPQAQLQSRPQAFGHDHGVPQPFVRPTTPHLGRLVGGRVRSHSCSLVIVLGPSRLRRTSQ
jgi:hypothetical protein